MNWTVILPVAITLAAIIFASIKTENLKPFAFFDGIFIFVIWGSATIVSLLVWVIYLACRLIF